MVLDVILLKSLLKGLGLFFSADLSKQHGLCFKKYLGDGGG